LFFLIFVFRPEKQSWNGLDGPYQKRDEQTQVPQWGYFINRRVAKRSRDNHSKSIMEKARKPLSLKLVGENPDGFHKSFSTQMIERERGKMS
jgi:hypothetical protein